MLEDPNNATAKAYSTIINQELLEKGRLIVTALKHKCSKVVD